jgi:hypothetical protein
MADDRNRREDVDDYSGADPGRPSNVAEETIRGTGDEIRSIVDDDDDFDDTEDLEDDEEGDGSF